MNQSWQPYRPTSASPWDWRRVVHLHRRAGFGAPWRRIQRDVADGPEEAIQRAIEGESNNTRNDFESMSSVIGDAAVSSGDPNRLKAWWLYRMLFSPHPLEEKLTLLMHNHFATSNLKVNNLAQMRRQNELFRQHAHGKFRDLLPAVVRDPAMLIWLDANLNRRGQPNENLARELLELFTLGIGNYTEDDIKQAARSLTGWSVKHGQFEFRKDRHDPGEKTILGETRTFDGDSLLQLLLKQETASERLAWRLCMLLMGEQVVGSRAVAELAQGLREHDLDIRWAVETVLRSQLFFSDQNIASRISSPVEYIVATVRSLEMLQQPPSTLILAEWCTRLGQDLFHPPNVGGWNEGRAWLTSRTIVARANFAAALVAGHLRASGEPPQLQSLAHRYTDSEDLEDACQLFGRLLLASDMSPKTRGQLVNEARKITNPQDQVGRLVSLILSRPEAQLA